jgi:hypothetical protein
MRPRPARPFSVLTALHHGSWNVGTTIASTTAAYDVLVVDAGTQADPLCRLIVPQRSPARDVLEIRLLSGLTWEELGELFHVTRRSVHNWASGAELKAENILLVRDVLRAIRQLRRASSAETRLALLAIPPSGRRPLDLLKAARWADAIAAVHGWPPIPVPTSAHPDPQQRHPTAYFDALTDRPHPPTGRAVRGRSRRMTTPRP